MIPWNNKKQKTISISITKAKYITLRHVARKAVWIRKFINKMKLKVIEDLTLYGDNKISIVITKNAKNQ